MPNRTRVGLCLIAIGMALACGGGTADGDDDGAAGEAGEPSSGSGGSAPTGGVTSSGGAAPTGGVATGGSSGSATGGTEAGGSSGAATGGTSQTGGAAPTGGTGTGGTSTGGGGSSCPQVRACNGEDQCSAALGSNCGTCSLGTFACGDKTGFYSTAGEEFICASSTDCAAASQAAAMACARCASTGGTGGSGGGSAGSGGRGGASGSAGSGGSGGTRQRCPPIQDCTAPSSCAPITTACSRCDVDEYTCTGGSLGTYKVHRTTDGQQTICVTQDCTTQYAAAYARCCP